MSIETDVTLRFRLDCGRLNVPGARRTIAYLRMHATRLEVEEVKGFLESSFFITYEGPFGPANEAYRRVAGRDFPVEDFM